MSGNRKGCPYDNNNINHSQLPVPSPKTPLASDKDRRAPSKFMIKPLGKQVAFFLSERRIRRCRRKKNINYVVANVPIV
jgi:hypothetical protein